MTGDIVTLVAQNGGVLGLALFAIWMLNRVQEDRLKQSERHREEMERVWADRLLQAKQNAEMVRSLWAETKEALEQNTQVITQLLERLSGSAKAGG